jgi:arylsulfatase A-like enzyme
VRKHWLAAASLAALLTSSSAAALAQSASAPNDTFLAQTERAAANREPVIRHPAQEADALGRLAKAKARFGKSPNVVVILFDDVGWGDFGAFGGGLVVGAPTPNIDKLASEGLRLTSAYSQPSCTPTRASLMTGRLPVRSNLLSPFLPGENSGAAGLNGEITLAERLKQAGYDTRAVGKWHLGASKAAQPQNVGFDHYYGILTSSDDYTAWREPWRNPDISSNPERSAWAAEGETMAIVEGSSGEEANPVYPINLDSVRFVDEKLTEHATRFIKSRKKSSAPFFLYLATRGAHNDNYPHPDFVGKSPAGYPYKDVIVELDHRVGQVVEALEESGQIDNTIIMITSDNGPFAETFPDTGYTPFRGAKATSYEGGQRTPFVAYWKGMIEPGRSSDGLFDLMDIFATTLTLAGHPELVPTDRYIDSIDQSGFLIAPKGESARRVQYYWTSSMLMGVRIAEFKYMLRDQIFAQDDTWPRLSPFQGSVTEAMYGGKLYDLYIDPKEEHALGPLKQPQIPVLRAAIREHLKTFEAYPPKAKLRQ